MQGELPDILSDYTEEYEGQKSHGQRKQRQDSLTDDRHVGRI